MNPHVELNSRHNDEMLMFTLSGVNVSLANAIRRTILSDIPLVVFRTTPYQQNKANIISNTSRLNNEILKQRLSCIPIYIKDIEGFPMKNYQLEVNVENITDTTMYVTTKDFVIKDLVTGKPISESKNSGYLNLPRVSQGESRVESLFSPVLIEEGRTVFPLGGDLFSAGYTGFNKLSESEIKKTVPKSYLSLL